MGFPHDTKDYLVVARYTDNNERCVDKHYINGTFIEAGKLASKVAKELDEKYGDSHYWNVMLYDDPVGQYGAYCELFHGRTS